VILQSQVLCSFWFCTVEPERIWKWGRHRSGAKVGGAPIHGKNFFWSCPSTFWL